MKRYLIQLKQSLFYNILLGHWHLVALFLILFLIFYKTLSIAILLLFLLICLYFLSKQVRLFLFCLFLMIIIVLHLVVLELKFNNRLLGEFTGLAQIHSISPKESGAQLLVKTKDGKYLVFIKGENLQFKAGDILMIKGIIKDASKAKLPNGFNYHEYLKNKKIYGQIENADVSIIDHRFTIAGLAPWMGSYYEKNYQNESSTMLKTLVLGLGDSIDREMWTQINKIGISHLFVVSGLHVSVFIYMIGKILSLFKLNEKYHFLLIIPFLVFYLLLMDFMVSVIRVFLMEVLKRLNKYFNLSFSNLDILAINIIIVILINPLYIYQMGFILTYLISGIFIISSHFLEKFKNEKLRTSIILCSLSLFISIPVLASINPEVNILSMVFNLVYIPFVSVFLLPFSLIVTIIPQLDFLYAWIVKYFILITQHLSQIKLGILRLPKVDWMVIIIYYGLFWFVMMTFEKRNIKKSMIACSLLFFTVLIWHEIAWFNPNDEVYFLDMPHGEACLIRQSFNQANILIDTGEKGYEEIHLFLKSLGIRRIDYLIISHGDSDHCGEALRIMNDFKVKTLVLSKNDHSVGNLNLLNGKKKAVLLLAEGDTLIKNKIIFKVLSPNKLYLSANNNSLVLYGVIFGRTFLFTGDIESQAEKDLINNYPNLSIDILKVAHHGSLTSTSDIFINNIKYGVAVIMSGHYNTFGFPNPKTLGKLHEKTWDTKIKQSLLLKKRFWQKKLALF